MHRYFLYLALAFLFVLAWDVWKAMWFTDPATGQESFGIGVGTLDPRGQRRASSPATRSAAIRSGIWSAGGSTSSPGHPTQAKLYDAACRLNCNHMRWAWVSLFSVALSDLYVRLCSMGVLTDWRIF